MPSKLNALDIGVIQWDIPKDGICLLELFKGINFNLIIVLQFGIQVRQYHYVKQDPQV